MWCCGECYRKYHGITGLENKMFSKVFRRKDKKSGDLIKRRSKWIDHIMSYLITLIDGKPNWRMARGEPKKQLIKQTAGNKKQQGDRGWL